MAIQRTPEERRQADIEKARMLLAKAEKAGTEEEAETFNDAAERLIARLGIDRALIDAAQADEGKREQVTTHKFDFGKKGDPLMEVNFVFNVADGFGFECVQWNSYGGGKTAEVFGFESDIESFVTVYTSLRQQAETFRPRWESRSEAFCDAKALRDEAAKRRLRRGYMLGFAKAAGERIAANRRTVVAEAQAHIPAEAMPARPDGQTTSVALVLADRQAVVKSTLAKTYPKIGKARGFRSDVGARRAGYADGQKASLGTEREVGAGSRTSVGGR